MQIIYGTSNKGKVEALHRIVREHNFDVEIKTLKDIRFNEEIIEDGKTFEENSEIKARAIKKYCDKNDIKGIIITDDAGLCVEKLNGEPGVYSARYAGENATQMETLNKLLNNLKDYPDLKDRTATFVCVLTAILQNGEKIVARGESKGAIATKIGKIVPLTYEPIFIPEGFELPMSEMERETYASVHNHRDLALNEIIQKIKKTRE